MSWINELYLAYQKIESNEKNTLLPISHSTANAQIEIMIKEDGEFVSATRITDKKRSVTIIPVTEDSGARSAGIFPHPLNDKLFYIAGDYSKYVSEKKNDNSEYYKAYMEQLLSWKNSEYHHMAVEAIYKYLAKGCVMRDLINAGTLILDNTSGMISDDEKINGIDQKDSFIRFRISYKDITRETKTWEDVTLYQAYLQFSKSVMGNSQLCYASGEILPVTYKHPSKIRNAGDKAKLISTNDESGFTYRGRFQDKTQALSVSYEYSQMAHNALKWLLAEDGIHVGTLAIVAWESNLQRLPAIIELQEEDKDDEFNDFEDMEPEDKPMAVFRNRLQKQIWGKLSTIDIQSKTMILGVDAATTGRLAISIYTELNTSEFLKNIERWHTSISWYRFNPKTKQREISTFSLYEIVDFAFGTEQGGNIQAKDELRGETICRLIPCVVQGRKIPQDILRAMQHKVENPVAYEKNINWKKSLECVCGLIKRKKLENNSMLKEEYIMTEGWKEPTRDNLYGMLLAIADFIEETSYEEINARTTNAMKSFEAFSNRPYQTWQTLYSRIVPYLNKMSVKKQRYCHKMIEDVMTQFSLDDYKNNTKLQPEFLLAFYCMKKKLYTKQIENKAEEEE
ncbi:MAG: type I-C CRISPR-associated protein Cas8c/Csd1 [Eubacteriales bacterium]|nr:type I-C CRISPR-associated protein Cas8c/Csd1 [Eubacteriales bacterium]